MKKINKIVVSLTVVFLLVCIFGSEISAQCPMCRMAAESNLQDGGTEGRGLNTGILYMLAMPYLLVATIGFIWYRNRKLSDSDLHETE